MQGTRLPDAVLGEPGAGWDAWEKMGEEYCENIAPLGAYMKVLHGDGQDGSRAFWYIKDPTGELGTIGPSHHQVVEHADGTITVTPAILKPGGWHGFLRAGVWSTI
jgi:hypothetical protein